MSTLGRHIRTIPNREGLSEKNLFTVALPFSTAAITSTQRYVLPVDAMLVAGTVTANSPGLTSGSTQVAIDNETQSTTDLDGGNLDLTYNDSDGVISSDILNGMTALYANAGDVYLVTLDAETGTPATDLTVILTFVTT